MKHLLRSRSFVVLTTAATLVGALFLVQKVDTFAAWRLAAGGEIPYIAFLAVALFTAQWILRDASTSFFTRIFAGMTVFLPTAVLVAVAPLVTTTAHIPATVTICVGFYIFGWGLVAIGLYTRATASDTPPVVTTPAAPSARSYRMIFGATLLVYGWFMFHHLGNAFYVDEKLWVYDRIENYWDNLLERDWVNTRPSDKPGVTTAIVSGVGLLRYDPSDFRKGKDHKDLLPSMFAALRTPQVAVIAGMAIAAYVLVRRVVGARTALAYFILLALAPLLIGMSRMINPDALLWGFFTIGFLLMTRYIKDERPAAIYAAGVMLGLALLTKYIANIFFLFFAFMAFVDLALDGQNTDRAALAQRLRARAVHVAAMGWIALSVFYALYPGAWVEHSRIALATIHSEALVSTWIGFAACFVCVYADIFLLGARGVTVAILTALRRRRNGIARAVYVVCGVTVVAVGINVFGNMAWIDFPAIIASPKSAAGTISPLAFFVTAFYPLVFGVTPVVLGGAIIACARRLFGTSAWTIADRIVFFGAVFILLYYVASLINQVVPIIRYQIVLYPLCILIAAIGWSDLLRSRRPRSVAVALSALLAIGTAELAVASPFYFSYNSPLLPRQFVINSKDMGDGNYEIAQYLNNLPNAAELFVWTDKSGVCQFFVGKCTGMARGNALVDYAPRIDYYVVSQNRRGFFRRTTADHIAANPAYPLRLDRLYDDGITPVYTLLPNGRPENFVRVLDGDSVSILAQEQ